MLVLRQSVFCFPLSFTILLFSTTAARDHRQSEENSWRGEGSSSSRKSDEEQGFESDSEADEQRLGLCFDCGRHCGVQPLCAAYTNSPKFGEFVRILSWVHVRAPWALFVHILNQRCMLFSSTLSIQILEAQYKMCSAVVRFGTLQKDHKDLQQIFT
jgi:hypothetical protein